VLVASFALDPEDYNTFVEMEDSYRQELLDATAAVAELVSGLTFKKPLTPAVPVTAEFTYQEVLWYFKSRYDTVSFTQVNEEGTLIWDTRIAFRITTDLYGAGVLPGIACQVAIVMFCRMLFDQRDL
jgi:hypothetical protein